MGPNLYLTPPGSFTHFHQDGHGTVDSGHFCIRGYNEVVMLRRMSERHMENALHFLKCNDRRKTPELRYDALYGLPHHNVRSECAFLYEVTLNSTFIHFDTCSNKSFFTYRERSHCGPIIPALRIAKGSSKFFLHCHLVCPCNICLIHFEFFLSATTLVYLY
jgi:hypothetical protein